jgi:hypothetical protein
MWVPARSTGARRGFCLGYTACLAPLASACLPRRVTPRGASLFFFLSRARVLDRRLLPSEAAEPSLSLPFPAAPPSPPSSLRLGSSACCRTFWIQPTARRRDPACRRAPGTPPSRSDLVHGRGRRILNPAAVIHSPPPQHNPLISLLLRFVQF